MKCCELCRRRVPELTRHHLIPRTRHARVRDRRAPEREELSRVAELCRPCHKQIHSVLDEKELERRYHSLEALAAHPEIRKFLDWVRDKPGELAVSAYRSNHRPRRRRSGPR